FNKRHGRVGHVFEARFGASLVEEDAYFREVGRYIVLNPVRARLVEHPSQSPWSCYRATAGQALRPPFLTIAPLLRGFADDYVRAQRRYAAFVLAGIGVEAPDSIGDVYTGSAGFADRHAPKRPVREVPRRQWDPVPPSLETVFAEHDGDAIAQRLPQLRLHAHADRRAPRCPLLHSQPPPSTTRALMSDTDARLQDLTLTRG
ncbi:MAG TPA: hypothetical protein VG106_13620, partial [Vicinamibacterales bacterium]|nr:hypothetical protein [Vicinamibacterales bacterium]